MIDCSGIEGIEPSRDMGAIAEKRGVNVVAFGAIEDAELEENAYDMIYLNGSSSYMEDLTRAFDVCKKALTERHLHLPGRPGARAPLGLCICWQKRWAPLTIRSSTVLCPSCHTPMNCALLRECGIPRRKIDVLHRRFRLRF